MHGDVLTTKERVKARIDLDGDTTTWDDFFDNLILGVTARMEALCGRRFIQATFTHEIHDGCDVYGSRREFLVVKNAPVQVVSSIQYNGGTNSAPNWLTISEDEYHVDLENGIIRFPNRMPAGSRNVRITYTGGYSGYSVGVSNFWVFNITPSGLVNGSNRTFTLPEEATQVIVYADGLREASANVDFTSGEDEFTLADGRAPYSTIAADYKRENQAEESDYYLPADLVEVCEAAVVRKFKRRLAEGRKSESSEQSSITWTEDIFTAEDKATMKNYRRGYNL